MPRTDGSDTQSARPSEYHKATEQQVDQRTVNTNPSASKVRSVATRSIEGKVGFVIANKPDRGTVDTSTA